MPAIRWKMVILLMSEGTVRVRVFVVQLGDAGRVVRY